MSDPCPICPDSPEVPASHALRKPVVNPDTGSPAPASAVPCAEDGTAPMVCNDGYRFPLVAEVANASERCELFEVKTPCADRWAYPGLLVEIYGMGHAEVAEVTSDWLRLRNLTILSGAVIGVGKPILPIPRAPDELGIFSVSDDAINDPANATSGALSKEIRFPVMVPTSDTCEPRWRVEGRKGMCGIPLTTSADQSQIKVMGWNEVTGCVHFIPNGTENSTLKIIDGKPQWGQEQSNKKTYKYTGEVQVVTIPAGMVKMRIKCWGAGGGGAMVKGVATGGGVGGFTSACVALGGVGLEAGDKLSVIVGEGIATKTTPTYGFGGNSGVYGLAGGGLSGVFKGDTAITSADSSRALIIAGGGGGLGDGKAGQPGNVEEDYLTSENTTNMQGDGSTTRGGGGGGHRGGAISSGTTPNAIVACGGTAFPPNVEPSGSVVPPGGIPAGTVEVVVEHSVYGAIDPPRTNDFDYASGVGRSNGPGRVVIEFLAVPL